MKQFRLGRFTNFPFLPVLPILLAPMILVAHLLFSGQVLFWGLPALQFNPWRIYAWENLRQGLLPLWNPLNGMGAPFLANYQLAIFYPPSWLLYLFAFVGGNEAIAWGHTLLVAIHLVWAGIGMAILLKRLGTSYLGQAVGGLAFGLCGYLVARNGVFPMIWTAAWLPWVILGASQIAVPGVKIEIKSRFVPYPLIINLTMMFLAGHAQLAWYTILLAAFWVLVGGWGQDGIKGAGIALGRLVLAGMASALLASVQLLPTAEYLLQSQRSAAVDYELGMAYSFWPWRLLVFLAPGMFGSPGSGNYWGYAAYWEDAVYLGVFPLLLAASTLSCLKPHPKNVESSKLTGLKRFLWLVAFLAFILALGKNTPIFPFLYRYVPTFAMFQAPTRFMLLTEFCLALLAGLAVDHLHRPEGSHLRRFRLSLAGAVAITIGAGISSFYLRDSRATFIPATALAGFWAFGSGLLVLFMPSHENGSSRKLWNWLVVSWVALDLIIAGSALFPGTSAVLYSNGSTYQGPIQSAANGGRIYLSAAEEYRIKFNRFFRFSSYDRLEDWNHLRAVLLPGMNLLDGVASTNNFDPLVPGRYARWMQTIEHMPEEQQAAWLRLMGVHTIETIDLSSSLGVKFDPVEKASRWYWASCPIYAQNEDESLKFLAQKLSENSNLNNWVILEGNQPARACATQNSALIQLMDENPQQLHFKVESDQAGWFVLSDTWYPGWQATVDGKVSSILRANDLFRAVVVPAGQHMVVFRYQPGSVRWGFIISLIAWLLFSGLYFMRRKSGNSLPSLS